MVVRSMQVPWVLISGDGYCGRAMTAVASSNCTIHTPRPSVIDHHHHHHNNNHNNNNNNNHNNNHNNNNKNILSLVALWLSLCFFKTLPVYNITNWVMYLIYIYPSYFEKTTQKTSPFTTPRNDNLQLLVNSTPELMENYPGNYGTNISDIIRYPIWGKVPHHLQKCLGIHPGRLTWNLQIIHLERKIIFQTSRELCSMLIFRGVGIVFLPRR